MSTVLFIGPIFNGSTTSMRLEAMKSIFKDLKHVYTIDTQKIIDSSFQISRVLAYRYKTGPICRQISRYIIKRLESKHYDIIWVEKSVLIQSYTVKELKSRTKCLIHFTPDPAFLFHKTRRFLKSIRYYDFLITTKSFELEHYYKYKPKDKIIFVTQGFSDKLHKLITPFKSRKNEVVFIGHYEHSRAHILRDVINEGLTVNLCGRGWGEFKEFKSNKNFFFLGEKLYGKDYVNTLNRFKHSIGFLSNWIPEMHTTRTFEIPACGCLLLTPDNEELRSIFKEDEVLFYNSARDLILKLKSLTDVMAENLAHKGHKKVVNGSYSHFAIMQDIFQRIGII